MIPVRWTKNQQDQRGALSAKGSIGTKCVSTPIKLPVKTKA